LLATVFGCAPHRDDSNAPPLRIEPPSATLFVRDGIAVQQSYQVIAHDKDGDHDVTHDAMLVLQDPTLGMLDGASFTSSTTTGGRSQITAAWKALNASSDLAVLMTTEIIEGGAPSTAPGLFGGGKPGGAAPMIAYPSTGVILPPNMNKFEFDYVPATGQTLFELEFIGWATAIDVYVACTPLGSGCAWTPTQSTWMAIAESGRGNAPLSYTVRGLAGNIVGESAAQTVQFTGDDLVAGIYYWAASQGVVMRYDFGHPEIAAEKFLTVTQTTGLTCVGCHVVSRDGKMIAVGLDVPGPATLEMYDVQSKARQWTTSTGMGFPSPNGGNFFTISPDNKRIASSGGTNLVVRSATDGTGMTTAVMNSTMPDWSPDGSRIVFAQPGAAAPASNPGVQRGSIVTVDATTFGGASTLVQSQGENNYYPSYSPDGNVIVFNRSANAMDSYDQPDARIYIVPAAGGPAVLQAIASPSGGDSWPKWSTQPHTYQGGTMYWLTFASRRAYGLHSGGNAQIWMVGIDADKALAGQDASFAAFYLPFQDSASGNHIAQWVETVVRPTCGPTGPCPAGEFCMNGECYPNPQ
jgi:hypothetical protein